MLSATYPCTARWAVVTTHFHPFIDTVFVEAMLTGHYTNFLVILVVR